MSWLELPDRPIVHKGLVRRSGLRRCGDVFDGRGGVTTELLNGNIGPSRHSDLQRIANHAGSRPDRRVMTLSYRARPRSRPFRCRAATPRRAPPPRPSRPTRLGPRSDRPTARNRGGVRSGHRRTGQGGIDRDVYTRFSTRRLASTTIPTRATATIRTCNGSQRRAWASMSLRSPRTYANGVNRQPSDATRTRTTANGSSHGRRRDSR